MEKIIRLKDISEAQGLFGPRDENITLLEKELKVKLVLRGESLKLSGTNKNLLRASEVINGLLTGIRHTEGAVSARDIERLLYPQEQAPAPAKAIRKSRMEEEKLDLGFSFKGKTIGPRTAGQYEYIQAIKQYDIVFGVGPAGTGKTYMAMAMAVEALRKGYVRRIILTRPALEAGESLGYLPGTLYEKILPYLRPLYDALYDMMEAQQIEKYIEIGTIEVAPLAYMRGRTLNDAFIILDEAQNCTVEQLKMFLTRLGFDSKTVITGDITQSDLPGGKPSGLSLALNILKVIDGIKIIHFNAKDVVRHELVQRIIAAYEKLSAGRDPS